MKILHIIILVIIAFTIAWFFPRVENDSPDAAGAKKSVSNRRSVNAANEEKENLIESSRNSMLFKEQQFHDLVEQGMSPEEFLNFYLAWLEEDEGAALMSLEQHTGVLLGHMTDLYERELADKIVDYLLSKYSAGEGIEKLGLLSTHNALVITVYEQFLRRWMALDPDKYQEWWKESDIYNGLMSHIDHVGHEMNHIDPVRVLKFYDEIAAAADRDSKTFQLAAYLEAVKRKTPEVIAYIDQQEDSHFMNPVHKTIAYNHLLEGDLDAMLDRIHHISDEIDDEASFFTSTQMLAEYALEHPEKYQKWLAATSIFDNVPNEDKKKFFKQVNKIIELSESFKY